MLKASTALTILLLLSLLLLIGSATFFLISRENSLHQESQNKVLESKHNLFIGPEDSLVTRFTELKHGIVTNIVDGGDLRNYSTEPGSPYREKSYDIELTNSSLNGSFLISYDIPDNKAPDWIDLTYPFVNCQVIEDCLGFNQYFLSSEAELTLNTEAYGPIPINEIKKGDKVLVQGTLVVEKQSDSTPEFTEELLVVRP